MRTREKAEIKLDISCAWYEIFRIYSHTKCEQNWFALHFWIYNQFESLIWIWMWIFHKFLWFPQLKVKNCCFFTKITSHTNNHFTKESNLRLHYHTQNVKPKQQLKPSSAAPNIKGIFPQSPLTPIEFHINGKCARFLFYDIMKSFTISLKMENGKCIITI